MNITFKSIMKINKLFDEKDKNKFELSMKILGLDNLPIEYLDEIFKYIFKDNKNNGKRVFDYEEDYKYYYYDFYKLGIDLNKNDISWWQFDAILEGLFLDTHSAIGQVIQYRTYEKPTKNIKASESKEHRFYMDKKRQYMLPAKKTNTSKGFNSMWNILEKKVGENHE